MRAGTLAPLLAMMAGFPGATLSTPTARAQDLVVACDRHLAVALPGHTSLGVALKPCAIDLFQHTSVVVTGVSARSVEVRLIGATAAAGSAYKWTPYRWQRLRLVRRAWRGSLPAPALRGIYQLQLRVQGREPVVRSLPSLLRVF